MAVALVSAIPVDVAHSAPSRFKQVDTLPLFTEGNVDRSGWLILNPTTRRGYQLFEQFNTTVVQSFDLDTLAPRRRLVLNGIPVVGGVWETSSSGVTHTAGEVVHAVDREAGRIYVAMSEVSFPTVPRTVVVVGSPDGKRPLSRFVMIDEVAFDRNDGTPSVASFREPVAHAHLHFFNVMGMQVARDHRLLVTFAHPAKGGGDVFAVAQAHTVAQWDVAALRPVVGHESRNELNTEPLPVSGPEARVLEPCARASMASSGASGTGSLQWGLLATADALYLACQSAPNQGIVVRVPLTPDGSLDTAALVEAIPLGLPVADVMVDEGAGRLVLRTLATSGQVGERLVVFDAATRTFGQETALTRWFNVGVALGLDGTTGRLYALVPDHATGTPFGPLPVQGGLQYADTRTTPALHNVDPSLAYPGLFRIQVDPSTGRFFVRRGDGTIPTRAIYPGTDWTAAPAPVEPFYRVFEDRAK